LLSTRTRLSSIERQQAENSGRLYFQRCAKDRRSSTTRSRGSYRNHGSPLSESTSQMWTVLVPWNGGSPKCRPWGSTQKWRKRVSEKLSLPEKRRSRFSRRRFPWQLSVSLISWNAETFVRPDIVVASRKMKAINPHCRKAQLVGIQDMRRTKAMMMATVSTFDDAHLFFASSHENRTAGGATLLVEKARAKVAAIQHLIIIPGRVPKVVIQRTSFTATFYHIRNYKLGQAYYSCLGQSGMMLNVRKGTPLARICYFFFGDLNFYSANSVAGRVARAGHEHFESRAVAHSADQHLWDSAHAAMIELEQPDWARFGTGSDSCFRVDVIFRSMPSWVIPADWRAWWGHLGSCVRVGTRIRRPCADSA
jgi:hypothetical protein